MDILLAVNLKLPCNFMELNALWLLVLLCPFINCVISPYAQIVCFDVLVI